MIEPSLRNGPFSTRIACREGSYRKSMHRTGQLLGQRGVHPPLALEPAEAGEGLGHDLHAEMALPSRPRPGMAGMTPRLLEHDEQTRRERSFELAAARIGDGFHLCHLGCVAAR